MNNQILDRDAPALREIAKEVPLEDIKTSKIKAVIDAMKEALKGQDDGVAIAAPQIGVSLRIFVVSGRTFSLIKGENEDTSKENDAVFINPEILKLSKKKKKMEEGCLSVRWLYGKVERSEKIHIKAYDENGEAFERGASGLLSQIFQHEIDHLNGILFIDKAEDVENIPPQEKEESLEKN